ncbi:MAG: hypothetical protein SFV21_10200 [Rhodospirillaceae bacterium]|nr:hypothetical protein [Rhodospirillaceae bacterium]
MSPEMMISLGLLVLEAGLIALCILDQRKPPDPLKPRLLPTKWILPILVVAFLATLAHVLTLLTGQQVQPRRMKGMG